MRVLLVKPSQKSVYGKMKVPVQIHMGLAYIAAYLKKEMYKQVEIVDIDAEGMDVREFADLIRHDQFDIVGFTVTTPTFSSSVELARCVKRESPRSVVVFGGIHPTIKPFETAGLDCVDIAVRGEGEVTFGEIVEAVRKKADLSGIRGILYKKDGKVVETPPRSLIEDLDALPFPARKLFKNKKYTYPDSLYSNAQPIFTSRGCPGMCTYCNSHQTFNRVFRARSAENVVNEIECLVRECKTREIHIWDDNFLTDKKRVFAISDNIKKRNLKVKFAFPNGVRADFIDKDVIGALKNMGAYSVAIGVESGSQEVLEKARKGIKLEKMEEALRLIKESGLESWAFFIIGLPGENADSIRKTIEFANKMDPDIAKFHILKPYPGTEAYDYLKSKKLLLEEDYDKFGIHTAPVHRLEDLTPDDMLEWQKKAYASFYLRPAKLAKQLFRIKTFNRLMINLEAGAGLFKMYFKRGR